MTNLEEVLDDPATYRGQIELFFDADGDETAPAYAEQILVWANTKQGIRYISKE